LGGTSPAPLPPQGLARHAPPGPILYALWVSKMSVARMTAPALASSRTRPGRPFATAFSPISAGVFGRFLVAHALRFEASYSRPGLGPPAARFGASTGLGGNRPRLPPPYSARGGERCAFPLAGAGSAGVLGAGTPGDLRGGWPGMGSALAPSGHACTRGRARRAGRKRGFSAVLSFLSSRFACKCAPSVSLPNPASVPFGAVFGRFFAFRRPPQRARMDRRDAMPQ
jgi:hypothetical protein